MSLPGSLLGGNQHGLRTWDTFGRGWSRRVARVEAVAVRMAVEASTLPARPTLIAEKTEAEAKARREGTNAGGVAVGGGAGTTLADLPDWTILVVVAVVVLAVINLLGRRRHEQERAAAFQAVAQEARA